MYRAHIADLGSFFKDRTWLRLEFPELVARTEANAGPQTILEVGCVRLLACLGRAIALTRAIGSRQYRVSSVDAQREPRLDYLGNGLFKYSGGCRQGPSFVFVSSATREVALTIRPTRSIRVHPTARESYTLQYGTLLPVRKTQRAHIPCQKEWSQDQSMPSPSFTSCPRCTRTSGTRQYIISSLYVIRHACKPATFAKLPQALKPGGTLFVRDYARHDLAQLRIKKDRLLDPALPGLYIRGDGTRVYFFKKTEMEDLLTAAPRAASEGGPMFEIEQSDEDRRLVSSRSAALCHMTDAALIVGEPKREAEDVSYLVAAQGQEGRIDHACREPSIWVWIGIAIPYSPADIVKVVAVS